MGEILMDKWLGRCHTIEKKTVDNTQKEL